MELLEALKWRYATKRMNGQKVPEEKLNRILEAIQLAPTSMGLQPFSVIVVEDENVRKKISEKANKQPQVLEGSHLLIFAAWDSVTPEKVDGYMADIAKTRGLEVADLGGFKDMITGFVGGIGDEAVKNWTARQAYIAFGVGLVAAANEQVDATPMEGFDNAAMDEVLGLKEKGLNSVVMITLGYRDEKNDSLVAAEKVRRQKAELFVMH